MNKSNKRQEAEKKRKKITRFNKTRNILFIWKNECNISDDSQAVVSGFTDIDFLDIDFVRQLDNRSVNFKF